METRNEIEKLAYEIFEMSGRIPGREMDHWFEAERIVHSRNSAAIKNLEPAAQKGAAQKSPVRKGTVKTEGKTSKTGTASTRTSAPPKAVSAAKSKKTKADKTASMQ